MFQLRNKKIVFLLRTLNKVQHTGVASVIFYFKCSVIFLDFNCMTLMVFLKDLYLMKNICLKKKRGQRKACKITQHVKNEGSTTTLRAQTSNCAGDRIAHSNNFISSN